jgi:hypothetical protein
MKEAPHIAGPLFWGRDVELESVGEGHCSGRDRRCWSAVAAAVTAPEIVNGTRGTWMVLLRMSAVAAVLNAAAYLKKSPLPAVEEEKKGD